MGLNAVGRAQHLGGVLVARHGSLIDIDLRLVGLGGSGVEQVSHFRLALAGGKGERYGE